MNYVLMKEKQKNIHKVNFQRALDRENDYFNMT